MQAADKGQAPQTLQGQGLRIGIVQARVLFAAVPAARKQFRVVAGADHNHVLSVGSHALYSDLCQFFLAAVQAPISPIERME